MRYYITVIVLSCYMSTTFGQPGKNYDIFSYSPPKGFTLKDSKDKLFYHQSEGIHYCQLFLYPAVTGTSDVERDFKANWDFFARNPQQGVGDPINKEQQEADGWKVIFAGASGSYGGQPFVISLTTLTKGDITFFTAAVFTDEKYLPSVQEFTGSIEPDLKKYVRKTNPAFPATPGNIPNSQPVADGFHFTRTNFDDGWVAVPQADWVETTKGNIKALIHYPNKVTDEYMPDGDLKLKTAWNNLVAPRYSNAANMFFKDGDLYFTLPDYASAEMTDNATGKRVYVVLFKTQYYNGSGKYVEIIAPSQQAFEQAFGNYETNKANKSWGELDKLQGRNKFAVAASDLKGTWTSDFGAAISYVYVSTGLSAGMDTHSSSESFAFLGGGKYEWNLGVASGQVGNIRFQSAKATGKVTVPDNWHVQFSDISGRPRKYDAMFSCIKGLRILWLDGKAYAKKN
jgi:hypothetical protein